MLKLHTVVASTRPNRVGICVASWFRGIAKEQAKFEERLVDLKEIALPAMDEPNHPRTGSYTHEHTKQWSALIKEADAFVFVTPEYNYGAPPALLNALNYLFSEWACKPCAFVSYGGLSGGTRSVQMTKQIVTTLKMMPLPEAVAVPFVNNLVENGRFNGTEAHLKSATGMLDELHRWATELKTLR